ALSPYFTFRDTNSATPDLRLKPRCAAMDAGDSNKVKAWLRRDIRDTVRQYRQFDMGAFEIDETLPPDTVRRSIGTNAGDVFSTGTVTALNANKLYFPATVLPAGIGEGDKIFINQDNSPAGQRETTYVYQRVNDSILLVWPGVQKGHATQDYVIRRVYNTMSAWESARQGDLVTDNRVEKGIAYNDGAFSETVILDGSTTDSTHFLWLSANPKQRHNGLVGTGVRVSSSIGGTFGVFTVYDDNVRIEGFEISSTNPTHAFRCATPAGKHEFSQLLIHDLGGYILSYVSGTTKIYLYNSLCYNVGSNGIVGNIGDLTQVNVYNVTALRTLQDADNTGAGIRYATANNCIVMHWGPTTGYADFLNLGAGSSNNISHDASATSTNSLINQKPYDLFVDTTASSVNLRLRSHSPAIGSGTDLSALIVSKDFKDSTRGSTWDIGADQFNGNQFEFKAGTNEYSIGRKPDIPVTVSGVSGTGPWTVSFSNSPDLSRTFAGDAFNDGSTYKNKWYITAVDNTAKTVTVANNEYNASGLISPSTVNTYHPTVGRFFSTMQAWEDMRDGNLVAASRKEKGVCYKDDTLKTGVVIDGSTTNETNFMWLTSAQTERHNGVGGTGVVIKPTASGTCVKIDDDYTIVEWLDIVGVNSASFTAAITCNNQGGIVRNTIVRNATGNSGGISLSNAAWQDTMFAYNNVVYDIPGSGINADGNVPAVIANNTVFGCADYGIAAGAESNLYNNIAYGKASSDFTLGAAPKNARNNLSFDATAPGSAALINKNLATQFVDTNAATINLNLKRGADAFRAGDSAGLSRFFIKDIRDTIRYYGRWDIGAFEFSDMDSVQLYVDYANGVDAAGYGTSPTTPYKNIEYAYDQLGSSVPDSVYVINLLSGTHVAASPINIDATGPDFTEGTPLIIRSYSSGLDSIAQVATTAYIAGEGTFAPAVSNVIFDRLVFRGTSAASSFGNGACISYYSGSNYHNITVKNSIFHLDSLMDDRRDSYRAEVGINLHSARRLKVFNNVFIGRDDVNSYDRGQAVQCGGDSTYIANNTFYKVSNAWRAYLSAGMYGSIFVNNMIDSCASYVITTDAVTDTLDMINCGFRSVSGYIYSSTGNSVVNLKNEKYVNVSPVQSYDWRKSGFAKLFKNSPLRDAGKDTTGVPSRDFYGIVRSGAPDIGACELNRDLDFNYADTINLFVDYDKADNSGDGRSILTAKKHVQSAYDLIPSVTDSLYIVNLMPSAVPYQSVTGGNILLMDGSVTDCRTWTRGIIVQSYYSGSNFRHRDSIATVVTTVQSGGTIRIQNGMRHVHMRGLHFKPTDGYDDQAIGFVLGTFKNFKISECVFDTLYSKKWNGAILGYNYPSSTFDSLDIYNNIFISSETAPGNHIGYMPTVANASYGVKIYNNTFRNSDILFVGFGPIGSGRYSVTNNIFDNVTTWLFCCDPGFDSSYINWNVYHNVTGMGTFGTLGFTGNTDTLMRDPKVVSYDWNHASFGKLHDESPCIGFGKDSSLSVGGEMVRVTPAYDFYGLPREGGNDVGACQYDPLGEVGKRVFQWEKRGGKYAATEDAYISSTNPTYNYGIAPTMTVGPTSSSLLRFNSFAGDESPLQVPKKAHVDSAFIYLKSSVGSTGSL
ncbi:MAG: hypothetical protein JNL74_04235, partial [Fibrobacteres bacterium]|nr:hypothetical protein [Fibrobacterota bacterium]